MGSCLSWNYLWNQGQVDSAIDEFTKAVEFAPASAFPLRALANVYEDRQEWSKAQSFYERALELEPDSVVANMNLARMFKEIGDLKLAKTYADRALFLDSEYEAARSLLNR